MKQRKSKELTNLEKNIVLLHSAKSENDLFRQSTIPSEELNDIRHQNQSG